MIAFLRRHNIAIQLLLLITALSSLSLYNYVSQQRLFIGQLQSSSSDLLQSVRTSITKFHKIERTLSLQSLVQNVSLRLEIFEFRYLDSAGVVVSSMFQDEVGKPFERPGIELALADPSYLGAFYAEERDLTNVMAITYPVYDERRFIGLIDLAVDVTGLDYVPALAREAVLRRLETDIRNLVNAISASIVSRIRVFETVDLADFLDDLVRASGGVLEVSLADGEGQIYSSSDSTQIGRRMTAAQFSSGEVHLHPDGRSEFHLRVPLDPEGGIDDALLLAIDASDYVANERQLFFTSLATGLLAVLAAVTITFAIYRINLRRAHEENLRLERMVQERTNEIERLSKTDKLTGLGNRGLLEEQLDFEYKRARRYHHPLTLLVVDLDHFKRINDNYGHLAGDAVLKEICSRLRGNLRDTDFIGRYGGEEFVVILPETELAGALTIAEDIRRLVEHAPVAFGEAMLSVTASIGVAELREGHGSYKELFALADQALYYAKGSGRNRVTYFAQGEPHEYPADEVA